MEARARAFEVVSSGEVDLSGVEWTMVAKVGGAIEGMGAVVVMGSVVELTEAAGVEEIGSGRMSGEEGR